jgi:hypothetical protein
LDTVKNRTDKRDLEDQFSRCLKIQEGPTRVFLGFTGKLLGTGRNEGSPSCGAESEATLNQGSCELSDAQTHRSAKG